MNADDNPRNNNNNDDADEAAARLLQEQIWMEGLNEDELRHWAERPEGGAEDDDDDDDHDDEEEHENNNADPNPNNPEIGRGQQQPPLPPPAENDEDDDDEDDDDDGGGAVGGDEEHPDANNNLDEENDDDPPHHDHLHHRRRRNAIDGGIAGDVIDDNTKTLVTRSLKCPLVLYFEILSSGGGEEWDDDEDDDDNNMNNIIQNNNNVNVDDNNAARGGGDERASKNVAIDHDDEPRRQKRHLQQQLEALSPDNLALKKGTVIYVGLDKNSKLSLVFDQFCKFVNSKIPKTKGKSAIVHAVKPSDFEFVHATILDPEQTVEGSALMKNDHIGVFPDRSRQRAAAAEWVRQQRESDRKYFRDLRQLLYPANSASSLASSSTSSSLSASPYDVVLDCRGRVVDERGYSQNVLATTIRANSIIPSKRCRWLGMKIELAREELRRRKEMTISSCEDTNDDDDEEEDVCGGRSKMYVAGRAETGEEDNTTALAVGRVKPGQQSDDEDDTIIMAEEPAARNRGANVGIDNNDMAVGAAARGVAKVEDDEDEYRDGIGDNIKANGSELSRNLRPGHGNRQDADLTSVRVILPDHSPQAVKLLLEYCYTNRVPSLGEEAFVQAGATASALDLSTSAVTEATTGPVPPFRKQEWPDGGMPTISLHLALAGIALAEEAHMPRLSLMCEIAASQLVDNHNVVDVLSACQIQQQKTGNRLPILRRAAMLDCIMANGSIGIDQLYANQNFKNNLNEKRGLVVPSLLDGSVEVLPPNMNTKEIQRKKEKMVWDRKKLFENCDTTDKNKRIMERLRWRNSSVIGRRLEIAFGPDVGPDSVGLFHRLSKKIWRDQNDPPSLPASSGTRATVGRGTKRKASSDGVGSVNAVAPERTRRANNTRSRHARNVNLA